MATGSPFFAILVLLCIVCVTLAKNVDTRYKRQDSERNNSCESAMQHLLAKVQVSSAKNGKGPICSGECCDRETEELLRRQGQRDLSEILSHNSKTLLGPISRTSALLKNHVWELTHISENNTLELFSRLYRGMMTVLSKEPLHMLYRDIREYIRIDPSEDKPTTGPEDIVKSVNRFFSDLFPVAYLVESNMAPSGDFSDRYKQCLKEQMEGIVPFGNYPKDIARCLSKSLEATRLLLQAFDIGMEVLNTTDKLIISDHTGGSTECHSALLKMMYCSTCRGFRNSKPCSGYCLNVLRGCTSKYVAELDLPWSSYVEGMENIVNAIKRTNAEVNVDVAIRNLDGQISGAIMHLMEKQGEIDKKVKMTCKMPEFTTRAEALTAESTTIASIKSRPSSSRSFPHFPESQFATFLSTMSKTKGFYADLADNLCGDESFADQRDKKCWNGERIGEYTKTIVGPAMDMQKYNPELKLLSNMQSVDPTIATLVDKLRHVHHMAVSSLGPNYTEDYMQRDGVDGSGSGNGPDIDDDEDDSTRGSGSGNGPIETDDAATKTHVTSSTTNLRGDDQIPSVRKASGGNCLMTPSITLLSTILSIVITVWWRY